MAKPSSRKKSVRKPAPAKQPAVKAPVAQPTAVPDEKAVASDAQAPGNLPEGTADQADQVAQGTSPDEATAANGIGEAQGEPGAQPPAADERAQPNADEDGEDAFDEVFGDKAEDDSEAPANEDEAPASEPAVDAEPVAPNAAPSAPSAGPEKIRLGHVDGVLHRVPLEVVQSILGQPALERVELLRSGGSTDGLQKRMRATDGRCAPMIFTSDDPEKPPVLFSGLETLAAAIALGQREVSVVTIATHDAEAIQSWLSRPEIKDAKHEDDVLQRVQTLR